LLDDFQATGQKVVDSGGSGWGGQLEALSQLIEDARAPRGPEVEVAAEEKGRFAGPLRCGFRRAPHVLGGERGVSGRCMEVCDAEARCGSCEGHRAPLGPARVDRQLAALRDLAGRPLRTDESEVRATLAGGDQVGVEACREGADRAQGVARCEHPVLAGPAGAGEPRGEARRALLKQRHIPLGAGQQRREFGEEVAVDLNVGRVSLGDSQQPRAPGEQRRVRWEIAPVEEVPGDRSELHPLSISGLSHFLTGEELGAFELGKLLDRAQELKAGRRDGAGSEELAGRSIALVFEKPSTRTRISFEVGVAELGGTPIVLRGDELQLSRGESIVDTARVLSRYVDAIVIRSGSHEAVSELAANAEVPVVNALTPLHHPCQALADLLTLRERFGDLQGLHLAYVGDGNNVARSLAIAGELAQVEVTIAAPAGYQLEEGHSAKLTDDPRAAAAGADAIYTDVWVSMGDEAEAERRRADLAPFRVDADLLSAAKDSAVVLHCLPAHPGEEITEEVLYGSRSAVWDQAENRLHTQKALLATLLGD
jgi:ornithine carbamoyltransferase